jgi:hypothetical protein
MDTALILQKVLVWKCSRFNIGNSIICAMSSNYRIAATLYTLETWFVSGM